MPLFPSSYRIRVLYDFFLRPSLNSSNQSTIYPHVCQSRSSNLEINILEVNISISLRITCVYALAVYQYCFTLIISVAQSDIIFRTISLGYSYIERGAPILSHILTLKTIGIMFYSAEKVVNSRKSILYSVRERRRLQLPDFLTRTQEMSYFGCNIFSICRLRCVKNPQEGLNRWS